MITSNQPKDKTERSLQTWHIVLTTGKSATLRAHYVLTKVELVGEAALPAHVTTFYRYQKSPSGHLSPMPCAILHSADIRTITPIH